MTEQADDQPRFTFYYDIGSPYAWVVAERLSKCLPEAEWQPVAQPDVDDGPLWDGDWERIFDFAQKFGLLPPRYDENRLHQTIADSRPMMLAATYAKSIGRTVAFSLAAFRQIYNAAKPVDDGDTILLAAAACEVHPRAVLRALELDSTRDALAAAAVALRERVGGRTELPLLLGTTEAGESLSVCEDELFALALSEFAPVKSSA